MLVCPGYVKTGFQKNVHGGAGAREGVARAARGDQRRRSARWRFAAAWSATRAPIVTPAVGLVSGAGVAAVPLDCGSSHGGDERNGMILKLKRTPGIYVVGFMASGKSTVGRHLAHRLGWNFFDTDEEIEAAEKMTIAEIFTTRGEAEFRRIESRHHPAACPVDRARPSGGAGAGRRRVRGAGESAGACRKRHQRVAGLSVRGGAAAGGQHDAPSAGAGSDRSLPRCTRRAAEAYGSAEICVTDRERRSRGDGGGDHGITRCSNDQSRALRKHALAIFRAALAAADPAKRGGAPPGTLGRFRASATSTSSARGRRERPWRRPRSACWAGGSRAA